MTVSSTKTTEFDVAQIILMAYRKAGLKNTREALQTHEMVAGKWELELILDELEAHGVSARSRTFREVTLTEGTYIYTMPTWVLNVIGAGMYIQAGESDLTKASGEILVQPMTVGEWQMLSSKDSTGTPYRYMVDRTAHPVSLRYWPIPDEAGTVRHQVHQLLGDVQDTTATPDLQRYWTRYLVRALAFELAENNTVGPAKLASLKSERERSFVRAKAYARQRPPQVMVMGHRTNWRGR